MHAVRDDPENGAWVIGVEVLRVSMEMKPRVILRISTGMLALVASYSRRGNQPIRNIFRLLKL